MWNIFCEWIRRWMTAWLVTNICWKWIRRWMTAWLVKNWDEYRLTRVCSYHIELLEHKWPLLYGICCCFCIRGILCFPKFSIFLLNIMSINKKCLFLPLSLRYPLGRRSLLFSFVLSPWHFLIICVCDMHMILLCQFHLPFSSTLIISWCSLHTWITTVHHSGITRKFSLGAPL